jgi:hypothetical protein
LATIGTIEDCRRRRFPAVSAGDRVRVKALAAANAAVSGTLFVWIDK